MLSRLGGVSAKQSRSCPPVNAYLGRILRIDRDVTLSSAGADIVRHLGELGIPRR